MGLTSERAAYAIMALSVELAGLSRMTWLSVSRLDGFLTEGGPWSRRITARDIHSVTTSDGDRVLYIAGICAAIAIVSLVGPPIRRLCGLALAAAAGLATMIAAAVAIGAARGSADWGDVGSQGGDYQLAVPLLLTILISVTIAVFGGYLATIPDEKAPEDDLAEKEALQW